MDLAVGFPESEQLAVTDFLLARPWQELLNAGYITDRGGNGFFCITREDYKAAVECASLATVPTGLASHGPGVPANLDRVASIRFRKSVSDLYEGPIRDTKDLVDQYSIEGVASVGKFLRKAADAVLFRFKTVERLFEDAYITQLGDMQITPTIEQWLRSEARKTVEQEVARAQTVTESLLPSFMGASTSSYQQYVARLQGEGQTMLKRLDDSIALRTLTNGGDARPSIERVLGRNNRKAPGVAPMIFISHSSKDEKLAAALIDLLLSALPSLGSRPNQIRCTSVPGYKLEGGAETDSQLRREMKDALVFIGLLTRNSLRSTYVLFELGARWGAGTRIKPLVAAGFPKSNLRPPLSGLHVQSCDERTDLHQMLREIGTDLDLPMAPADVYDRHLVKLLEVSKAEGSERQSEAEAVISARSGAFSLQVGITAPVDNSKVLDRPYIGGTVSDASADVWVVVHSTGTSEFWTQPRPTMKPDGTWVVQAYIGRSGNVDVGKRFEIIAVANPEESLGEGLSSKGWPRAQSRSQVVEVTRR